MIILITLILIIASITLFIITKKRNEAEIERVNEQNEINKQRYPHVPSDLKPKLLPRWPVAIITAIAAVTFLFSFIYAQDPGESIVIQNWGGSLAGHSEDAGFHVKAPWQGTVKYDVRNNILSFVGTGEEDYTGGSCRGPQLTINDMGGAAADIDVQVNYALDPGYVETLYADYGTQENFVHAICAVDIRATAREVAGGLNTITILTNRGDFSDALYKALERKWEKYGIHIEQVNVQDVRYNSDIHAAYASAQQAEIDKATAQNKQEVAKTEADTKVEVAKREAEANAALTSSLSPEILQQRYIEALQTAAEHDNLIVVPEGSTPLVGSR